MADTKDGNPKDLIGAKKLPLGLVPDTATAWTAMALLHGALKYGRYNWRDAGVRVSIYVDALRRHVAAYWNGEDLDPESGLPHLAHVGACVNILLDAWECDKLTDDRPQPAPVPKLQADLNEVTKRWVEKQPLPPVDKPLSSQEKTGWELAYEDYQRACIPHKSFGLDDG